MLKLLWFIGIVGFLDMWMKHDSKSSGNNRSSNTNSSSITISSSTSNCDINNGTAVAATSSSSLSIIYRNCYYYSIPSLTVFTLFVSVLVCITMVRGMVVWILQVCNCLSCLLAWSQTASQNYGPTVVKTQSQPS